MNEAYYVKTEEKEHTVKIQNEDKKFYSYDGELVEDPTGTLIEKTITENGEYLPSEDNADGYSKVTVEVPVPTNKLPQVVDKTVTEITAEDLAGCTSIGNNVFSNCSMLTRVTIPEGVTSIGNESFAWCSNLQYCTFPSSVTSIGNNITYQNFALVSITILATTPPTLASTGSFSAPTDWKIYVPAESVDAYKTATNWSYFASRIQAIPA